MSKHKTLIGAVIGFALYHFLGGKLGTPKKGG